MTLKQISVFLENSPGRLLEVATAFGDAGINLKALSLTGSSGFGVLRLIVSDLQQARTIAMEHRWPARVDEVVAVRIADDPGSLAKLLAPLYEQRVDVEYMYSISELSVAEAVMIFGFKETGEAVNVLQNCSAVLLSGAEFGALGSEGNQAR